MKRLSMMLQRPITDDGIDIAGISQKELEECLRKLKYTQGEIRENCWYKGCETLCVDMDNLIIRPLGL